MWILGILALGHLVGFFAGKLLEEKGDEEYAVTVLMTTVGAVVAAVVGRSAGFAGLVTVSMISILGSLLMLGISRALAAKMSH